MGTGCYLIEVLICVLCIERLCNILTVSPFHPCVFLLFVLLFFLKIHFIVTMCMCVFCVYFYAYAASCRGQEKLSDLLELESQAIMSHLIWVLRTELQSARVASAING